MDRVMCAAHGCKMGDETDQVPNASNRPVDDGGLVPSAIHASPSDMPGDPVEEPTWWRPSLAESLRQLGWRWVFMMPVALIVVAVVAALFIPGIALYLFASVKLILFAGGIAVSLAAHGLRQVVRGRSEPFCIHCGYNLTGLPDKHGCPECGRPYSWSVIAEYRKDPQWFIQRWRERRKLPETQEPFAAGAVRSARRPDGT